MFLFSNCSRASIAIRMLLFMGWGILLRFSSEMSYIYYLDGAQNGPVYVMKNTLWRIVALWPVRVYKNISMRYAGHAGSLRFISLLIICIHSSTKCNHFKFLECFVCFRYMVLVKEPYENIMGRFQQWKLDIKKLLFLYRSNLRI